MGQQHLLPPTFKRIVNRGATGADQTDEFDLPLADTYSLTLINGAGTGTSPTLDVSLQYSPDGGTTWIFAPIRFTQKTTAAATETITFKARLGDNEAATANVAAATGGQLAKNFIPSRKCRIFSDTGGTNPSYASIVVWLGCQSRSM